MNVLSQNGLDYFPAKNNHLQKLQRTNQNLVQLSQKLHSYTCEPCTYHLFEKSENLKARLRQLRKANEEIIHSVKKGPKVLEDLRATVKQQLRDFDELRQGIVDYAKITHERH